MYIKLIQTKDYYLTSIEEVYNGFEATVKRPDGRKITTFFSKSSCSFNYDKKSHTLPKRVERQLRFQAWRHDVIDTYFLNV
jgi:hypothetical protein